MIKMTSHHPLLVGGEARTEFETDELHARELEHAGLAVRVSSGESQVTPEPSANVGMSPGGDQSQAQELVTATTPAPEPTTPPAVVKPKKAK